MKGYEFQWRMAGRRKDACLLVLLFTAIVTAFMLIYPQLITSTKSRLDEAYKETEVKGWIYNAADYVSPTISNAEWKKLIDSGYFSEHASYMEMNCQLYQKKLLDEKAGGSSDEERLRAMQSFLSDVKTLYKGNYLLRGYNRFVACDDLMRVRESISWAEGYDESCLEGEERICIISDHWGYELGETIPVMLEKRIGSDDASQVIVRLKVAALYQGMSMETDCILPIKTMEQLCNDTRAKAEEDAALAQWDFAPNSFIFTIKDNYQLEEIKALFDEMGYDGSGSHGLRIAIDDRILQGTVAPIESNLALLEGLYLFFFLMVAAIGFFLCYLQARGRKQEYAIMRMLGESTKQVTVKALLEQSVLCAIGILFGAVLVQISGFGSVKLPVCLVILLCYSLGALVAVLLTVRVNVMEILRDKE